MMRKEIKSVTVFFEPRSLTYLTQGGGGARVGGSPGALLPKHLLFFRYGAGWLSKQFSFGSFPTLASQRRFDEEEEEKEEQEKEQEDKGKEVGLFLT